LTKITVGTNKIILCQLCKRLAISGFFLPCNQERLLSIQKQFQISEDLTEDALTNWVMKS